MRTFITYEVGKTTLTPSGRFAISKALERGKTRDEKALATICEMWLEKLINGTPPSDTVLHEMRNMAISALENMQKES